MSFVEVGVRGKPEPKVAVDTAVADGVVVGKAVVGKVGTGPDRVPDILRPQSGRASLSWPSWPLLSFCEDLRFSRIEDLFQSCPLS